MDSDFQTDHLNKTGLNQGASTVSNETIVV